jgi:alanine racemase
LAYSIQYIASVINATAIIKSDSDIIDYLLIDSRKIVFPRQSLFFALNGLRRDGHEFIKEVYNRGVRNFVVKNKFDGKEFSEANFLCVDDVLIALHELVTDHRNKFSYPVIGITGSNGKTIVKEWLNQLLQQDYIIVRSPRSFNSQIGVPLSVWQMNEQHTLGIFEAGISTVGEMEHLEKIVQPTIGILTNIGDAHREGFVSKEEKIIEKLKLFQHCRQVVFCKEDVDEKLLNQNIPLFSWSRKQNAIVYIQNEVKTINQTELIIVCQNESYNIAVPFVDAASVNNTITCICTLLLLKYSVEEIQKRILQLKQVEMRLQLKKGMNNCTLINDSYSNDISSLRIALDYLVQQSSHHQKTVLLSDIFQSGLEEHQLYQQIAKELQQRNIERLIGIGESISKYHQLFYKIAKTSFYHSTEQFIQRSTAHQFKDEFILLKGARVFEFERISSWLEQKVHQTVLEINLSALAHNVKLFQKQLLPSTKLMAMVKAFSYGSGSAEVARVLQFHKVDYLAVAYADEGIELRKADISLPIMVMNTDEAAFDSLIEYNLEPEIYSFNMYQSFHQFLQQQAVTNFPVHIKVNTGMNRLGFEPDEATKIALLLKERNTMTVQSVFSHLVGSEDEHLDDFTIRQVALLNCFCEALQQNLPYTFIKHIANSAAIFRHHKFQFDMVRLGIGMYGVDHAANQKIGLETVAVLKSTIAQIRNVKAGDTIGYNRKGALKRNSKIATVRIGYADGFNRKMGNGAVSVFVKNRPAPTVGNVCMDMMMIDVTDIDNVKEGDEVEIFGKNISVESVAKAIGTISYEIMTGISQRVKRVYVEE